MANPPPVFTNAAIAAIFLLIPLALYLHHRSRARLIRANNLKIEKLDEEINLLENDIKTKSANIAGLNEMLKRYSVLKDVVESFSATLSLEKIDRLIIEKALETLGKEGRALLFLVDIAKQELALSSSMSTDGGHLPVKAKKGDAFDHWVLRHRIPLIIEDITKDFRFRTSDIDEAKGHFRSLISAPLVNENKVMGLVRIDNPKELAYAQEDLRLLDILSDLGALAIQNAMLYSRTEELAIRDGLTNLFLRRYFLERLKEEVKRAARSGGGFSLLILDIDHFKEYNDRYGHIAGDLVLKHLSALISSCLDEGDIAGRYGGEEIAVLLSGADREAASREAEKIRKTIEANPLMVRRQKMGVTISIGISVYPEDARIDEELTLRLRSGSMVSVVEPLIKVADERLYKAKSQGRNRVCDG